MLYSIHNKRAEVIIVIKEAEGISGTPQTAIKVSCECAIKA